MRNTKKSVSGGLRVAAVLLAGGCLYGAAWTDRAEYDLALTIRAEAAPDKRLALLDQWKAKYPQTGQGQVRRELYLAVYQTQGAWPRVLEVAREMSADQPDNPVGLYWVTALAPGAKQPAPDLLDGAEKAARRLLAGLPGYFAADKKPAGLADAAWQKQKAGAELLAHRAIGWVQWQRKVYPEAEKELLLCLEKNPNHAEISGWLGAILAVQQQPERQVGALWHLARAGGLEGEGSLPVGGRRDVSLELERIYTAYHGGPDGLAELRTAAAAAPLPPPAFSVESASVIAARRQEEELNRTNPQLAAWLRIRKQLEGPDGEKYFNETLRTSPLPKLKGTLVRVTPEDKPEELGLGIVDPAKVEVVIKLDGAFRFAAEPGTSLEFEGTASAFAKEPFSLTVSAPREKVEGWPASRPRK